MKTLMITALLVLLSAPVFAQSGMCSIAGPNNCTAQSEDALLAITHDAIHHLQLTQDPHPFKTKNDEVLQAYAAQHAQAANTAPAPAADNRDWTFWR